MPRSFSQGQATRLQKAPTSSTMPSTTVVAVCVTNQTVSIQALEEPVTGMAYTTTAESQAVHAASSERTSSSR